MDEISHKKDEQRAMTKISSLYFHSHSSHYLLFLLVTCFLSNVGMHVRLQQRTSERHLFKNNDKIEHPASQLISICLSCGVKSGGEERVLMLTDPAVKEQ